MLDMLDRALPNAFAKYALGSVIMTKMAKKFPMRLYNSIMENQITTRRKSMPQFFENSIKKVGQQSIKNRMKPLIENLGNDWTKHKMKQQIRRHLNKTFFNSPWLALLSVIVKKFLFNLTIFDNHWQLFYWHSLFTISFEYIF